MHQVRDKYSQVAPPSVVSFIPVKGDKHNVARIQSLQSRSLGFTTLTAPRARRVFTIIVRQNCAQGILDYNEPAIPELWQEINTKHA
jgi:hypothetical protein